MPLLYDKLSMFRCKLLRFGQFSNFKSLRLPQFYHVLNLEDSFTSAIPNMHVYGQVLVAVEKEFETIFLENLWHASMLLNSHKHRD